VIDNTYEIEANNVVVAFHGVKLDGKATRVTGLVRVLTADSNSGEADEDGRLFADGRQEVGFLMVNQYRSCRTAAQNIL
jgi:hypothetical protein